MKAVLIKLSVFIFGFLLLGALSAFKSGVKIGAKTGVKAVKVMKKTDFIDTSLETNLNQLKRPVIKGISEIGSSEFDAAERQREHEKNK